MRTSSGPRPEVAADRVRWWRRGSVDNTRQPLTPRHAFTTAMRSFRTPPLISRYVISGYVISRIRKWTSLSPRISATSTMSLFSSFFPMTLSPCLVTSSPVMSPTPSLCESSLPSPWTRAADTSLTLSQRTLTWVRISYYPIMENVKKNSLVSNFDKNTSNRCVFAWK